MPFAFGFSSNYCRTNLSSQLVVECLLQPWIWSLFSLPAVSNIVLATKDFFSEIKTENKTSDHWCCI